MILRPAYAGLISWRELGRFMGKMLELEDNIINIKGIGEKTVPLYNKLGIDNVDDLIHYYPKDYVLYEKLTSGSELVYDKILAFKAVVVARPIVKRVRRLQITTAKLSANGVYINVTWFHMPFLTKMLVAGKEYVFRGKLSPEGDHYHARQLQIFSVEQYEAIENKIAPVYSLTKGLTNNALVKSVKNAFDGVDSKLAQDGLYEIHFPQNYDELRQARDKLVYEEFLLFILRLRLLKDSNEASYNDFNIIEVSQTQRIIERLPYRLTNAQLRVWDEIKNDLCSKKSMSRLVQGDVGSGKTILALLSAVMTAANGYQVAVMAPTEILASQHFEFFSKIMRDNNLDLPVVLLTGSMSASTKKAIRQKIETNEAKIIIGTHALIQEKVKYNNLALVVTDEQHRFGVNQRQMLSEKNQNDSVHVLVMSATPIPRTLAIILYGDLSISIVDEVPAHKLPIKSAVVSEKFRQKSYELMRDEIKNGHQVYIICPLVEESEGLEAKDVISYSQELSAYFDDSVNISYLHGKMKPKDKQKAMDDFANNNTQILVSTTVVEVGVNVPNATVMMIEDANRFGLAQLHQLRGRVGRGPAQSYCIFMSSSSDSKTMERLGILGKSSDGFVIAEEDLKQRGPGDLFGIRQSGDMQFRLADIFTDAKVLKKASEEATRILEDDPKLEKDEHKKLKILLENTIAKSNLGSTI